jgi:hypothetical protein
MRPSSIAAVSLAKTIEPTPDDPRRRPAATTRGDDPRLMPVPDAAGARRGHPKNT